jgi:hypothetical protein
VLFNFISFFVQEMIFKIRVSVTRFDNKRRKSGGLQVYFKNKKTANQLSLAVFFYTLLSAI